MAQFLQQKALYKDICGKQDWREVLEASIHDAQSAGQALNALLALLHRPELRIQAAYGLGLAVPLIAEQVMEKARIIMRRLMWSLNEESGNIGWGVPEAMGCILANSRPLAAEYARIFLSYGYETGKNDNYIDHGPLRRGVYWGMARLAQGNPQYMCPAVPHLIKAVAHDEDAEARAMAAWALAETAKAAGVAPICALVPTDLWHAALQAVEIAEALESRAAPLHVEQPVFSGRKLISLQRRELYAIANKELAQLLRAFDT